MSDWREQQLKYHLSNCALCDSVGPARPVNSPDYSLGYSLGQLLGSQLAWSVTAWPDTSNPAGIGRVADKVPVHDGWPDNWADKLAEEWGAE